MNKKELKKAFEEKLIDESQFKEELFKLETSAKKEKKPKKLPVAVSEEEFIKLLKHTNQDRHKLAYLLAFESGLRVSEIVGGKRKDGEDIPALTPDKINLKEKSIFVSQGKGSKDRIVPLPKHFRESYLKMLPIKVGIRALEIAFKRTCKRAGLLETKPSLHFHSLRHGFASHCVKNGVPIHHVRTLMGHSNISTTNIYLEMNPKEALKSVEELF